ncbi:hypothetical protein [Streptomyces sp. NPDC060184]|uniref:hypothetical protein n=1 Tax=Streptomyces sp. NPDC060184 TaxID=3347064 RepID=UPI003661FE0F
MSTEAQHAPVPPRPPVPPGTTTPPPGAATPQPPGAPTPVPGAAAPGAPAPTAPAVPAPPAGPPPVPAPSAPALPAPSAPAVPAPSAPAVPAPPAGPPAVPPAPAASSGRPPSDSGRITSETTRRLRPGTPAAQPPVPPPVPPSVPAPTPSETTTRLRPVPAAPARPAPQVPGARPPSAPVQPPAQPPVLPSVQPSVPPPAARRRPVGAVDLTPPPGALPGPPPAPYGTRPPGPYPVPPRYGFPETPMERTTRLRPIRPEPRQRARTVAAAVCVVLGIGLIGGAAAGVWLTDDASASSGGNTSWSTARSAWHSLPVDTLFPRTLQGRGAGPGGADRVWTRLGVAADGDCAEALDPLLVRALGPVGCVRVVRATYTDATRSTVTTVGMVFTEADDAAMRALATRFADQKLGERKDLMPRTYPVPGTAAEGFGAAQRAAWTTHVLTELPVLVYAVSGFADGRAVTGPQPAALAMARGATTAVAEAGLGNDAEGVADRVERALRTTVADLTEKKPR